jgi:hypothetical protein
MSVDDGARLLATDPVEAYWQAANHAAVLAARFADLSRLYEELRQAIDGGSESMTHGDAIQEVRDLRASADRTEEMEREAARYRWLKSRKALMLRSERMRWQRLDGAEFHTTHYLAADDTQYAPAESLDAMIDGAMRVASRKEGGEE